MSDLIRCVTERFRGKNILILGDVVADQFLSGSIARVSREAPVFILRHEETETRPGGAANAAANVASLGGTPLLLSVTGADENGAFLRQSLADRNVDLENILLDPGRTTTTKVRILAGQSYSVKQQILRIDHEPSAAVSEAVVEELADRLRTLAESSAAIVLSDYGYGTVGPTLFDEAKRLSAKLEIPLIVDSRFRLREFAGASSATPNKEEVEQLLGPGFDDQGCKRLREELGFESLLITCGNQGMIVVEAGCEVIRLPCIGSMQPVDVTGAGDTVIAAYSLALAAGSRYRDAAMIANHAGGIVVMKTGTATVSRDELLDSLKHSDLLVRTDAVV